MFQEYLHYPHIFSAHTYEDLRHVGRKSQFELLLLFRSVIGVIKIMYWNVSLMRIFRRFPFYVNITMLTSNIVMRCARIRILFKVNFIVIFICNNIVLLSIISKYFFLFKSGIISCLHLLVSPNLHFPVWICYNIELPLA